MTSRIIYSLNPSVRIPDNNISACLVVVMLKEFFNKTNSLKTKKYSQDVGKIKQHDTKLLLHFV